MAATTLGLDEVRGMQKRLMGCVGGILSCYNIMIGTKLELFSTLHQHPAGLTPKQLAAATETNELYIHQWLVSTASQGLVHYEPDNGTFTLPKVVHELLLNSNSPFYFFGGIQVAVGSLLNLDQVVSNIKTGKGFWFPQMGPEVVNGTAAFFRPIYLYSLVDDWFKNCPPIMEKLNSGGLCADVGCGKGLSTKILGTSFPQLQLIGYDFDGKVIEEGKKGAEGLSNVGFEASDACSFGAGKKFDVVCIFDAFHDMPNPQGVADNTFDKLKDDGLVILVEPWGGNSDDENISYFASPIISTLGVTVCMQNSRAGDGPALGPMVFDSKLEEIWKKSGFTKFEKIPISGAFNRMFTIRK